MTRLSGDQVRALVGQAREGRLTSEEQRVLAGLLTEAQAQLKAQDGTVRRLRQELAGTDSVSVACPYCGAQPREWCRPVYGTVQPRTPHTARVDAARKAGVR